MTETADVPGSACRPLVLEESAPDGVLPTTVAAEAAPVPGSEPFAEPTELGAPPARAELREYIEDTDIRFDSISDIEGLCLSAGSGNWESFGVSSAMFPGESLGVSKSSTAKSSLLVLLLVAATAFRSATLTR